ncbi:MAG: preprotein translocase subunit SecA [Myxococcota bacterium]|nr:preprotein translocase subunit SecA [Myxococcota bacterium]
MQRILSKVFGTSNDREIKRIMPLVEQTNRLEPQFSAFSDAELQAQTPAFRQRLENGEPLDDLLPEAFATVREASKRTLGQRHYDVQLVGGVVLHRGNIAEMKTGEGKTLVATLPSYLNGLTGRGVHIVTYNDYLAQRDAEWMGAVHRFLGLSVGVIVHGIDEGTRKRSYDADIAYATNNELGFDYLRDNMKFSLAQCVQRPLNYAIVDEVDSILIDEARTPLIISGPSEENTQLYGLANRVIPRLSAGTKGEPSKEIEETGDFWIDEKAHSATLTEEGVRKSEELLGVSNLYAPEMLPVIHAVNQALIAHALKRIDVDYVVKPGEDGRKEVVIVDEHTGRMMPGRRWSDGLHQAVEAKEGISVRSENQTLASVTFQNFFRMYDKISGMTGTADTEAPEFAKTYDLNCLIVPTNRPMIRADLADVVFKSRNEKLNAIADEIKERHATGQPVLVGTISIEGSEVLSKRLKKRGIRHNVLNAKQHEREAEIVAQAGRKGAVTISTNMAGRGTDIVLGGNSEFLALAKCGHDSEHPNFNEELLHFEAACAEEREEVLGAGGLHILGTERHESRRIDNQLRGRSGRQGDPGSSQFFLSLEDDLLRIFEAERVKQWWERVGVEEGEAIENRLLTRVIENAQKKVEARNFDIRKHLLEYDDVPNRQRKAFYERRRLVLADDDVHDEVVEMVEGVLVGVMEEHWPEKGDPDEETMDELVGAIEHSFGVVFSDREAPFLSEAGHLVTDRDELGRGLFDRLMQFYDAKSEQCAEMAREHADLGYPEFQWFERDILLRILDGQWKDHLHTMDGLREGITLRGYGQRDPKIEFQREGFQLFREMESRVDEQATEILFKFALPEAQGQRASAPGPLRPGSAIEREPGPPAPRGAPGRSGKIGRNDPCSCGSGKKFKKCHGA